MNDILSSITFTLLLGSFTGALGHGDHEVSIDVDMAGVSNADMPSSGATYFSLGDFSRLAYCHIALMILAWVIALPLAVMFSIARSRYTTYSRLVFMALNILGVSVGVVYNRKTPDLYPNNAHHKVGWLVTIVTGIQIAAVGLGRAANLLRVIRFGSGRRTEQESLIPVTTSAMAEHHRLHKMAAPQILRLSNDSGQGTERNTDSLRSVSISEEGRTGRENDRKEYVEQDNYDDDSGDFADALALRDDGLAHSIPRYISSRTWRALSIVSQVIDRLILIMGFITICLGIVAYGRFFEGHAIFTGLAHWIKGGIFFWMGLFTLGRWSGSFGELGWAWNLRPKRAGQKWRPSAEFVESALIFTYGITNIFLEHLGSTDGNWSSQDLEHLSITVLFIGGGLCGMLIESVWVRDLLSVATTGPVLAQTGIEGDAEESEALQPPRQYEFSLNPIPALVIVLLGIMMSSHTQTSMVSSMIHKQWGNLLTAASFSRTVTYVLIFLKPPRSVYPSRPPTEVLTAFSLISGGILFMASSGDTVEGMEHYGLDEMFMYTVTMGFVGLLMAWVLLVLAIKGWAARKEAITKATRNYYKAS